MRLKLFIRTVFYIDGFYLCAGHHTVAYLDFREVEGILENLHLILNRAVVRGIINAALHQII